MSAAVTAAAVLCGENATAAMNGSEAVRLLDVDGDPADTIPLGIAIAGATCGVVIIALGAFGNVLVMLAVVVSKTLYKSSNLFVVSLAVCDLFQTVMIKPLYVHTYIAGGKWQFGPHVCMYALYASNLAILESILHVSAIAFHRYIVIVHPRAARRFQGARAIGVALVLLYALPLLIVLAPSASRLGAQLTMDIDVTFNKRIMFCSFSRHSEFSLAGVVKKVAFLVIAAVFLFYCYTRIYLVVRDSGKMVAGRGAFSPSRLQREMTLLKTVVVIFFTFVVTYLPISVLYGVDTGRNFAFILYFLCVVLLWMSSSVNWMIYGLMNKQYLEAYRYILCGSALSVNSLAENGSTSKLSYNMSYRDFTDGRRQGRARISVCRDYLTSDS